MKVKKTAALSLGAFMLLSNGMPVFAKINTSMMDVVSMNSDMVEKTINNVSDVIQDTIDSIDVETSKPIEEVSYTYVREPVYYTVTETVSEPVTMSVDEFNTVYGQKETNEVAVDAGEKQAAYDAALVNYNAALAEYEAASQVIETTKEVEVEVTEETLDEDGNPVITTKTEIQTITETAYAGDVETARANLDAAKAALDTAEAELTEASNTVEEVVVEEEVSTEAVSAGEYTPSEGVIDDLSWNIDENGVLTITGTGVIPDNGPWGDQFNSVVIGEGITGVGDSAFRWNENVTSVSFSSTVTDIGEKAFYMCTKLSDMELPEQLVTIGNSAFDSCKGLTAIDIPESVSDIGAAAFRYCSNLKQVRINSLINKIEDQTFQFCESLTSILMPNSIIGIGKQAFHGCTSLEEIELPWWLETIGEAAFEQCTSLIELMIPNQVSKISDYAFYNCKNLAICSLDTAHEIGNNAFQGCESLEFFYFSTDLTSIGDYAFYDCKSIKKLTIPSSVTSLGEYAFYGCSRLESIEIPESITIIPNRAFAHCTSLTKVVLPTSITEIGQFAYYNTAGLINALLPESITEIKDSAFYNSSLKDIYFGGTEEKWNAITLGERAISSSVNIHYTPGEVPVQDVKHTLSLEGNIAVNFYFRFIDSVLEDKDARVDLTLVDNTVSFLVKDAKTLTIDDVVYYMFTQEVTSIQMTEDIQAKVFLSGDDLIYSETYTVREYAIDQLAQSFDEGLLQLMYNLLNYGGHAQLFFNYRLDDLANEYLENTDVLDVTAEMLEPFKSVKSGSEEGISLVGSTLTLDSWTSIKHYFKLEDGYSISDFTFMIGDMVVLPEKSGNLYYVDIPNIVSYDLDTMYKVSVGEFSIEYSALSYAYTQVSKASAKESLKNVCRALYIYNDTANKYFG